MAGNEVHRHPFRRTTSEQDKFSKQPIVSESETYRETESEKSGKRSTDLEHVQSNGAGHTWTPGFMNQFPIVSFGAIMTILALCAGITVVLVLSNEQPVDSWCAGTARLDLPFGYVLTHTWSIPPSVWISIFVFFAGKLMALAFAQAASISWWTNAMKGKTLRQLVHHWQAGQSVTAVLLNPRQIKAWICLASVAFTAFAGLGTILQKATSTVIAFNTFNNTPMTANMADDFPLHYSGWYDTNGYDFYYSPDMLDLIRAYSARADVRLTVENCPTNFGTKCNATLSGIGFQYNCLADLVDEPPYAPSKPYKPNQSDGLKLNRTLFDVTFNWGSSEDLPDNNLDYWNIILESVWKTETECAGRVLSYRKCILSPAVVQYPVQISQDIVTLADATSKPIWSNNSTETDDLSVDKVLRVLPVPEAETASSQNIGGGGTSENPTTIGGIYKFLNDYFASNIMIITDAAQNKANNPVVDNGQTSYQYYITGGLTRSFARLPRNHYENECEGVTMPDPMQYVASQLRDLMFRTSVAIVQKNITSFTDEPTIRGKCPNATVTDPYATLVLAQNVYQTDYVYLGLGIALMLVSIAAVLPLFWGFWNLGRKVSLSPVEMAKALHSTAHASNSDAAPKTPVSVFEAAKTDDGGSNGSNATTKELIGMLGDVKVKYGEVGPCTLGLAVEEHVGVPHHGQVYR